MFFPASLDFEAVRDYGDIISGFQLGGTRPGRAKDFLDSCIETSHVPGIRVTLKLHSLLLPPGILNFPDFCLTCSSSSIVSDAMLSSSVVFKH